MMASNGENYPTNSPESLADEYQRELVKFQAETRDALAECEQGKVRPLDVEALKKRVQERLLKALVLAEHPTIAAGP